MGPGASWGRDSVPASSRVASPAGEQRPPGHCRRALASLAHSLARKAPVEATCMTEGLPLDFEGRAQEDQEGTI